MTYNNSIPARNLILPAIPLAPLESTPAAELSPAGIFLYRRYAVRPCIADLVASLAGLGADRRAA